MTNTSRKTSRKPHAETTKDPRFNGIASSLRSLSSSLFALPKACQTIRFANSLPFFILVSLHKQACDAALNEKSLSLS
jgi:hypothetical protein